MKKLYLIVLLIALSTLMYAQDKRHAIGIVDSGAVNVDSVKVPEGYWLSGISFPALATGTDSIYFKTSDDGGVTFQEYWFNDEKLYKVIKSGGSCNIGVTPQENWAMEWFQVMLDVAQTEDDTLTFTFELKK